MKNNKGFTLIELLAVIVILAIIALIATPIVLGIINNSKESSNRVSAQYIVNAVEQSYNVAFALNNGITPSVDQVREHFKMENAIWDASTNEIYTGTKDNKEVVCEVYESEGEFSVSCPVFNIESMTMDINS